MIPAGKDRDVARPESLEAADRVVRVARGMFVAALASSIFAAASAHAAIPSTERAALMALYENTNGGAWNDNLNWCVGACPASGTPTFNYLGTECTWSGVACDDSQSHVVAIVMFNNHMIGAIPSLSALTALQTLDLDNDELTGPLPDFIGLTSLQTLDVHQNDIDGAMPAISGLTGVQTVRVFGNRLSGNLPALAGLANLQTFLTYSNDFTGQIPALDGLTALEDFSVADNALSGAIPDLSGLTSLESIRLGGNRFTGSVPALPSAILAQPASSTLCPNPLDTTPGPNDDDWNQITGHTPWWATPFANNLCDDVFTSDFEVAGF